MDHNGNLGESARRNYAFAFAAVSAAGALLVLVALLRLDSAASAGASQPANDDLADAMTIELTASKEEAASTEGATLEAGETASCAEDIGATVWYRFVADASGTMVIRNEGTQFATALAVYPVGDVILTFAALDSVACAAGDNARVEFSIDQGQTYYVQAGGADGATGELRLQFECEGCSMRTPPTPHFPDGTVTPQTGGGGNTPQPGESANTPQGSGSPQSGVTLPDTGSGGFR